MSTPATTPPTAPCTAHERYRVLMEARHALLAAARSVMHAAAALRGSEAELSLLVAAGNVGAASRLVNAAAGLDEPGPAEHLVHQALAAASAASPQHRAGA